MLVLDNAKAILCSGNSPEGNSFASRAGCYRQGYEEYGDLFKCVGETPHSSCLILTSREKPKEIASLEGATLPVRSFQLGSLQQQAGQEILTAKGLLAFESDLQLLVDRYAGNPLALKIVATTLQDVFNGSISEFLSQESAIFGDIYDLLEQQFNRLSNLEKEVAYWLTINREPISLAELQADMVFSVPQLRLLETLESLSRRSLIEKSMLLSEAKSATYFTLQPVVMEYVTEQLISQVCAEIVTDKIVFFQRYALLKATAKDYIKETQVRLILKPIIDALLNVFDSFDQIEQRLTETLIKLREATLKSGYTAGNILNLLCQLKTNLSGYDLSGLHIWQADLRKVNLQGASLQNANLAKSIFAETFGGIFSLAFSPNKILAVGDSNGEIRLYQATDGQQQIQAIASFVGHTNWVVSLAFSSDGSTPC